MLKRLLLARGPAGAEVPKRCRPCGNSVKYYLRCLDLLAIFILAFAGHHPSWALKADPPGSPAPGGVSNQLTIAAFPGSVHYGQWSLAIPGASNGSNGNGLNVW